MATVRDLIEDAFREAGVLGLGQTMKAEDYQLALRRLNGMIGQWNKKRWLTFHLTNKTIVSKGITGYTIGPTGDIVVTERPDKIYSASYQGRQVLGSFSNDFDDDFNIQARTDDGDVSLQIIRSREDYNLIRRKRQSGQPMTLFYEPSFPLGVFYLYPVPPLNSVNLSITIPQLLQDLSNLNTVIALPSEYYNAVMYNLAIMLTVSNRKAVTPDLRALAKDGLNTIRKANTQIPSLRMPFELMQSSDYYNGNY